MYIASLFNKSGLFQHLEDWRKKSTIEDQQSLEEFLFRATSAYLNLSRMHVLANICIGQYRKQKEELDLKDQRIVFWSPTLVEFLNEFSPFLSALRIMQNQLLSITARAVKLKKSIPLSLADAMKKLDSYGFGIDITQSIKRYWLSSGETVRGYRNIDQHYYSIVQHSFLQVIPEEKSQRRVSFQKERNALLFFEESFLSLHNLMESIATVLGFQSALIDQAIGLAQLGSLQESSLKKSFWLIPD